MSLTKIFLPQLEKVNLKEELSPVKLNINLWQLVIIIALIFAFGEYQYSRGASQEKQVREAIQKFYANARTSNAINSLNDDLNKLK